jgi:hypothetical protein
VSSSGVAGIRRYIETQEEHHSKKTFKDEFLELLAEHELSWDERYVWD